MKRSFKLFSLEAKFLIFRIEADIMVGTGTILLLLSSCNTNGIFASNYLFWHMILLLAESCCNSFIGSASWDT